MLVSEDSSSHEDGKRTRCRQFASPICVSVKQHVSCKSEILCRLSEAEPRSSQCQKPYCRLPAACQCNAAQSAEESYDP